ncbi:hypothetical protein PIB30_054861 [Stylosanthes scabra]|uniref:Uncharacterized protein n=1 Tax=Stylosanthes scabra TaxID=79078 RepID=A0ABU6UME8_9FABA|nr:hypothetical protein [Stylosanthes scabra]
MIDASAGGALMNKTPEEAWELIESVADNHICFKTRANWSTRAHHNHKFHPNIAGFVRVIRITLMNAQNCKKTMSLHPLTTTMVDPHKTANTNNNLKGGVTINKGVGTPTNNLNTANPITTTIHHKTPKIQDTNLHIVDNHTHQTTIPNPLMKKPFDLVNKRTRK